jgi:CDP-diglyceride synthetase
VRDLAVITVGAVFIVWVIVAGFYGAYNLGRMHEARDCAGHTVLTLPTMVIEANP